MTYTNLYNGSRGDDVLRLQQALQAKGYDIGSTGADGIYGWNTQQAVRKYQADNGLDIDGVAGNQTLTHLYGSGTSAQQQTTEPVLTPSKAPSMYDPGNDQYYQQAMAALQSVNDSRPTYNPSYDAQILNIYNQIVNRDPFEYDLDSDMLYQQYKKQYTDLGNLAMQDTMGQAAGLTGGYGSTYGQAVGQQQYNAYLQRLNDRVPELYDRAYAAWRDQGNDMLQQYSMLSQLRDNEYGRYQDELGAWLNDRNYAQGLADQAYDRGMDSWGIEYGLYEDERSDARDRIMSYLAAGGDISQLPMDLLEASGLTQAELDTVVSSMAPKQTGRGGSGGQDPNEGTGFTKEQVKAIQSSLGLPVTGIWDAATEAAYNGSKTPGDKPKVNATYRTDELLDAAAAGMKKSEIEAALANRGVNINDPAVQADIKWAMSK